MVPSPHRIRRQRWLVRTSSTAAALAWRTFLYHQGQDLILPLFEQAFAEIGGDDRFVHLPRLELHLTVAETDQVARDHRYRYFSATPRTPGTSPAGKAGGRRTR